MRVLPILLFTSLTVSCANTPLLISEPIPAHVATTPVPRDDTWWQDRQAKADARISAGEVDMLFIGDSITHSWEGNGKKIWRETYEPRNAINLGFSGDRTQHVLWRLDHSDLDAIDPKLAVIMIGTNNSGNDTPEQIADGVRAIVARLLDQFPRMNVLLLAIFPRGADGSDSCRQVNEGANAICAKLDDGDRVHYLDIGPNFIEADGTLTQEIMPDLLHLSVKGYQIWADSIEVAVVELMGEG